MCQANSSDAEASDRSEGAALQSGPEKEPETLGEYAKQECRPAGLGDNVDVSISMIVAKIVMRGPTDTLAYEAVDKILDLAQEVMRLRAALKPFAAIPPSSSDPAHYWVVNGSPSQTHFTREDLARARKALESSIEERSDTEVPAAEFSPDTNKTTQG